MLVIEFVIKFDIELDDVFDLGFKDVDGCVDVFFY